MNEHVFGGVEGWKGTGAKEHGHPHARRIFMLTRRASCAARKLSDLLLFLPNVSAGHVALDIKKKEKDDSLLSLQISF